MPQATAFRVLLGIGDKDPAVWDGHLTLTSGKVLSIQGWRFGGNDTTDGVSQWRASTRPSTGGNEAIFENGVLISLAIDDPSARVSITTQQGSFSFRPQDLPWGASATFLRGRARVDRTAPTLRLTTTQEEQDHPAIAQSGDDVWVSFVEFVHGDRSEVVAGFREQPRNFDFLARPAGGDQVQLLHYSRSRRRWTGPVPVSSAKQDIMRTAAAVDGKGRLWVFWSANVDGNFDIYAKSLDQGRWSREYRVAWDPGADLNPVAVTDSRGRVWLAWQGFRNDNLEILATVLDGDDFLPERIVSFSPANDWDPSLAAGPAGEVALAWDTYDKGNYDVAVRRMKFDNGISASPYVLAAASGGFEARASLAYDPQGRLWVAYETSDTSWGKDYGAYETTGIALYQGHSVRVRCLEASGLEETESPLVKVLPSQPSAGSYGQGRLGAPSPALIQPNPALAENRKPNGVPGAPALPRNSFPRLFTDPSGTIYLAFRNSSGVRAPVGTVWYEQLVVYDGVEWRGPYFIPHSDGLLDSRPVAAALGAGHILMVSAMDHRQSMLAAKSAGPEDPVNCDLYAAEFQLPLRGREPALKPVTEVPSLPSPAAEAGQIARMRNYRVTAGGEELRLLRGEFHRHTEISADGGSDGPVIDAFRYFLDAAQMDWAACCDHDNGGGREYSWWIEQKLADAYLLGEKFVPMFSYERSVRYPEGHRNVLFAQRGIRPLPRLPKMDDDSPPRPAPDTQMLYRYLRQFNGIAASHTSGTDMGTDWRDNDGFEPVVEIYQGDRQNYEMPGAPRANSAQDSIGGWRPLGFVQLALDKGYRLGFQSSSDHISTHMSYANVWATSNERWAILAAFFQRRVYASTDNILADVRCREHFMGEEFTVNEPPAISVKLAGTSRFARVSIIKDGRYVLTITPNAENIEFAWLDNAAEKGRTSYYYVRGEQDDGELVWTSPMWITVE